MPSAVATAQTREPIDENLKLDRERRPAGRYRDVKLGVYEADLPKPGAAGKLHIVHGMVEDPYQDGATISGGKRYRPVAVNKHTDALEKEYAEGRLSEAGRTAGRTYQLVMERSSGSPSGGGQWAEGSRVDADLAHEMAIVRGLARANAAVDMIDETSPIIGEQGHLILRLVLVERMTLAEASTQIKHCGRGQMAVKHAAWLFRTSLELLGEHWAPKAGAGKLDLYARQR